MQLERVMSIMRYWPAKGTAGFARSRVRGEEPFAGTTGKQNAKRISHIQKLR